MTDSESPAGQQTPEPTPQEGAPPEEGGQEGEQPQEEPKFVTEEQLATMRAEIIRDVTRRDKQRAQQIKQDLQAEIEHMSKIGVQLSPEQQAQLESEIIAGYDEEDDDEGEQRQQQPATDDPPQPVLNAIEMMKAAGTIIEDGDPEFDQFVKEHLTNPGPALLMATAKAIEAKQARTSAQKEKAPLRVPAGGGSGPGEFKAKDARQLWTRAHSK